MKVNSLIEMLKEFNPEANVDIIVHNKGYEKFSLCWGDFEGCKKDNCDVVSLYIDELNQSESAG